MKGQLLGIIRERLMIDSGAQCCVCPINYAPEIPIVKVDKRELPQIHSVTGATMKVEGVKYVTYQLANHHEMTVRYYVTDVRGPILSVNGLNKTGYSPVLSEDPYLMYFKNYITKLEKSEGLYYVVSLVRKEFEGTMTRSKVIAVSISSDYWKIEGNKAIRVHLKPRKYKFTPQTNNTYPGNGKENDPWLFRLKEGRITKVKFVTSPDQVHTMTDDWRHSTTSSELPEKWTGETIFEYMTDEEVKKPETKVNQVPEQADDIQATTIKGVDHWTKDGRIWTRHHVASRTKLFHPELATDGPKLEHLEDDRVTTVRTVDGETTTVTDNWRDPRRSELTMKATWTGVTVFNEKGHYPQLVLDDYADAAQVPKTLMVPKEPTQEERTTQSHSYALQGVVPTMCSLQGRRRLPQADL